MKTGTSHSSHRRKCIKCSRKTGDAYVLSESDIEIRVPVCDSCAINFLPDSKTVKFKPLFSIVKWIVA